MKSTIIASIVGLVITSGLAANHHETGGASGPRLEKLWETDAILKVPESVLFDKERGYLFVSNITGTEPWADDGVGSIGKVGLNGEIIEVDWVSGFHAPKGMGILGNQLYVADNKSLSVIDIDKAEITHKILLANVSGLNDVSVGDDGNVYVSDSKKGDIFRIENGVPTKVVTGLNSLNGVLVDGGELFYLADGALYRTTPLGGEATMIGEGMEGHTDGIERVDDETWMVSCWRGVTYIVTVKDGATMLLDTREDEIYSADLGYNPDEQIVYLPTFFQNTVAAYRLIR